jgi:SAM-dependent methyltransferase
MDVEQSVAQHYGHGSLERTILDALAALGKGLDRLTPADLAPVDEFHIGGRKATADFAVQSEIKPGMHLLDIGCGLGGASRYFALERGCRVTGIDLTEEYVQVAQSLARRIGLDRQVSYRQGSALALPFPPGEFDGAYMLHVGMNIQDKRQLFAEARRVLKPGGIFGIYDVMREGKGDLKFPVPWAQSPETSFVESAPTYRRLLDDAGLPSERSAAAATSPSSSSVRCVPAPRRAADHRHSDCTS